MPVILIVACCLFGLVNTAKAESMTLDFTNEAGRIFVGELLRIDTKWLSDRQVYIFKVTHWISGQGKKTAPSTVTVETNLRDQKIGEVYVVAQHLIEDSLIAMIPIEESSTLPERIEDQVKEKIYKQIQLSRIPLHIINELEWVETPIRIYTSSSSQLMDKPLSGTTLFDSRTQKMIDIRFIEGALGKQIAPFIAFEEFDTSQKIVKVSGHLSRGEHFEAMITTRENGSLKNLKITTPDKK